MTFNELHNILDDPNRILTKAELQQILYELKNDCFNFMISTDDYSKAFLNGEVNAFYIALDLLEHLGGE